MDGTSNAQGAVVVGNGPVGALLTILLSKRGISVRVYESKSKEEANGWTMNLTLSNSGLNALKAVGLDEDVLANAILMRACKIHPDRGEPFEVQLKEKSLYSIDRRHLYGLLQKKVEDIPITPNFRHKLIQADLDKKKLTFRDANDKVVADRANFIFGCDGIHSIVRQQMMRYNSCSKHYSKEYSSFGYKAFSLSSTEEDFKIESEFLHSWPREEFIMIAVPKQECSFSFILFMPFKFFDNIKSENDVRTFFNENFPDAVKKFGIDALKNGYAERRPQQVTTVKCFPHFMAENTLILGDAAHGFVPFNGMNAGFEDALVFYNLLEKADNDLCVAAQHYQDSHWSGAKAVADFSITDYMEIGSHTNWSTFLLGKK